ncbi:glucan phosphoethanolaminetransferase (alkaline phosphatase superfamily) [Mucilaginibacter sp. UYNi724]
MKLQKTTLIGLLILILLLSVIAAHFLPPVGLLSTPVIISLMTGLIIFTDNDFSIFVKSLFAYLFIGLNDIGFKLFAGGIHDTEGLGWVHLLLFVGLVPCFIMLVIGALRDTKSTNWVKIISILIFLLLVYIHFQVFKTLGVQAS